MSCCSCEWTKTRCIKISNELNKQEEDLRRALPPGQEAHLISKIVGFVALQAITFSPPRNQRLVGVYVIQSDPPTYSVTLTNRLTAGGQIALSRTDASREQSSRSIGAKIEIGPYSVAAKAHASSLQEKTDNSNYTAQSNCETIQIQISGGRNAPWPNAHLTESRAYVILENTGL